MSENALADGVQTSFRGLGVLDVVTEVEAEAAVDLQVDEPRGDEKAAAIDLPVERPTLVEEQFLRIDDFAVFYPQIVSHDLMISDESAVSQD